jgi:putative hemolysin
MPPAASQPPAPPTGAAEPALPDLGLAPIRRGGLRLRPARGAADLARVRALRAQAFPAAGGEEADLHDLGSAHLMVEEAGGEEGGERAALLSCCRVRLFADARAAAQGYSGGRYDLAPLAPAGGPLLELGRFCTRPGGGEADALRLALGALARVVDGAGVVAMFGCTSFERAEPARHAAALAHLARHHLGPPALRPGRRAAETVPLDPAADREGPAAGAGAADPAAALRGMPALLRSYLALGGWVGDHAVIDRAFDTLHVFTWVEVARIPPARAAVLRQIAAG